MEMRLFNEISQFNLACQDENEVWFVGDNYSLLFGIDIKECVVKKIIRIKDEDFIQFRHYWKLIKLKNKIALIPVNHAKIMIFHVDENRFSDIYLQKPLKNCMNCVKEGERLYVIDENSIVILNLENEKVEGAIPIPFGGMKNSTIAMLINGHLIIPLAFQAVIIDFHIQEKQFSYLHLDCAVNGFVAGTVMDRDIWLAGGNGNIVCWNYISKKCVLYDKLPEEFESFGYDKNGNFVAWRTGWSSGFGFKYWYDSFSLSDKVWFIPLFSNSLLYVDKKSNRIQRYMFEGEGETEISMKKHPMRKFLFLGIQDERYAKFYSVKRQVIYSVDTLTLCHEEENFNIDDVETNVIEKEYWNALYDKASKNGIHECRNISIQELTKIVCYKRKKLSEKIGMAGKSIYQCVDNAQG